MFGGMVEFSDRRAGDASHGHRADQFDGFLPPQDFWRNISWNENSRLEDYEFYIKLSDEGEFAFDPQVLSVWRHHGWNVSGDMNLMLAEVLAAQNRNPEKLDLNESNINGVSAKSKISLRAGFFAERFEKRRAQTRAGKLARRRIRQTNFEILRTNDAADERGQTAPQILARKAAAKI